MREGQPHIVDMLSKGEIVLVTNTSAGMKSKSDSADIRRMAIVRKIPYSTTLSGARAVVLALQNLLLTGSGPEVMSLQEYHYNLTKKLNKIVQ